MKYRLAITTLGCKVNQVESASLAEQFEKKGYKFVDFKEKADIYIVNTCAVTAKASYESRKLLRQALKNEPLLVVATGCYAQVGAEEILGYLKAPILIVGQREKAKLPEIIESLSLPLKEKHIVISDVKDLKFCEPYPLSYFREHKRAFLRVQDGCSLFCTYCIVPHARGPSRSLNLEKIREQVLRFLAAGYQEIVVTGVHLGLWGRDLSPPKTLLDLVNLLEELGVPRWRLSSLEPQELSEDILYFARKAKGFCPHFHLSLQSGSNEVLRKMGRRYKVENFERLVLKIKELFPDAAIGADVIAGFPAETEKDFEETYALIEKLPLTYLHVFPYSPRPGTPAARWRQVPPHLVAERARKLQELSQAKRKAFYRAQVGQILEVLILRYLEEQGLYEGLSRNYVKVLFEAQEKELGHEISVKVERAVNSWLYGSKIS
ncbi:MiaB-like tRNA modifying enzyme [Thermodesulfatator indicus DSM 15286]|uniref:tRNA (N(6)-L-threonylcarbamoyladenosine(37)-C(2))-methylthiotransferase n=1 Tax=Thermodesulfatator indicus (strain DSM 15286 / JCM 11887 / CIR29812) TaxID=667014 RepID=F8AD91_THEID|nr:tRNA (N(6)-L-threonylcarbamoyladenosine(37)-C(2))-methylthiotransferase MtaB [Thermodesulfatator indicus]AEH44825.1 MiaB-like tRNA modifying enzyme [Thermodesulfatator indicus DSM 15286]